MSVMAGHKSVKPTNWNTDTEYLQHTSQRFVCG